MQQHHSAEREEQAGAQGRRAAAPAPARGQPPPPQQQQPVEPARDAKKRRVSEDGTAPKGSERRTSSGNEWLRAWAWKREHRPEYVPRCLY